MSAPHIQHYINGRLHDGGSAPIEVRNPATGQVSGLIRAAGSSELAEATAAAASAFESWSEQSLSRRTAVLFAFRELVATHTDRIAAAISAEHGKTLADAAGEVARGLENIEFACGLAQHLQGSHADQVSSGVDVYSYREPLGVVAGITPFNFPAMVPLWMAPIAIACGNAFILKPSERDPSAALVLADLWQQAGLPDGVFTVLHGGPDLVEQILADPGIAAVSFVGSTPIARHVYERASAHGKRVQALGGAKNHAVVLPDADLPSTAAHLVAAGYGSAGQRCMAISAVVAVGSDDQVQPLLTELQTQARALVVGPATDAAAEMGPVITAQARDRVRTIVTEAVAGGARILVDGRELTVPHHPDGYFLGPTLLDQVRPDSVAYTEEIFGPVLVVLRASDLQQALEIVNANPYGNGAAIFTRDGAAARQFQRGVQSGMVGINVPIPVPVGSFSFGGRKDSLFGDTHVYGPEGVAFYTRAKTVTARWPEPAGGQAAARGGASMAFPAGEPR